MIQRKKRLLAGAVLSVLSTVHGFASANPEKFPEKPITILVGYPAGQSVDILARLIGEALSQHLGQPVIVENRPGAGGTIATAAITKSSPDGYTLSMSASGPLGIAPHLFKSVSYDPRKDFTALMHVASVAQTLVVSSKSNINTVGDLIKQAQASPGKMNFGSPGNGSTSHLTQEMFKQRAGVQMTHVPYKGGQAAITDLISGQIDVLFEASPIVTPFVKQGQLRALAVSTAKPIQTLPDTPTIASQGLNQFEAVGWMGMIGPAGMDPKVVAKLHTALEKTMQDPVVKQKLDTLGMIPVGDRPEQFDQFIKSEYSKWGDVVQKANVKIE